MVPSLILDRPPGQAPPVSIILSTYITCAELASLIRINHWPGPSSTFHEYRRALHAELAFRGDGVSRETWREVRHRVS